MSNENENPVDTLHEQAAILIANAADGCVDTEDWREAAGRFRDAYHRRLGVKESPESLRREQLEVQLAGCLTASERGGTKPEAIAEPGGYGWSLAYQRALDNTRRLEVIEEVINKAESEATFDNDHETGVRAMAATIRGSLITAGFNSFVSEIGKVATVAIVMMLALVGCATEPTTGTSTSAIEYTDGGPYTVFDTGILGPETEDGLVRASQSCSHELAGSTLCTVCCTTVRVCKSTGQGRVCWDEVRCNAPNCRNVFTGAPQ